MDERNNDFDFDFMPIGQAIKKAREARGMTREQLSGISSSIKILNGWSGSSSICDKGISLILLSFASARLSSV